MSQSTADILNQAYELIEQDKYGEAAALLEPLTSSEPENANVWWLYAHAVDDPQKGQAALQKVSELNPNYPGLDMLTSQVESPAPVVENKPTLKKLGTPTPLSVPESSPNDELSDELDFDDDLDFVDEALDEDEFDLEFGEDDPETPEKGGRNRLLMIGVPVVVLGLLAIGALILLPNSGQSNDGAAPTETSVSISSAATSTLVPTVADDEATADPTENELSSVDNLSLTATALSVGASSQSSTSTPSVSDADTEEPEDTPTATEEETEEPTETPEDTPTNEPAEVPTEATEFNLADDLDEFDIPEDGINVEETDLGDTLIVSVCVLPGPSASEAMLGIMEILSNSVESFEVDGIGVQIVDCESETPIRTVAVSAEDALDFAAGDIDQRGFQRLWQPTR